MGAQLPQGDLRAPGALPATTDQLICLQDKQYRSAKSANSQGTQGSREIKVQAAATPHLCKAHPQIIATTETSCVHHSSTCSNVTFKLHMSRQYYYQTTTVTDYMLFVLTVYARSTQH